MFARWKFYLCLLGVCLLYWLIDSTWSFFSFEQNIRVMIFSEPTSLWDPLLLRVSPYQMVSRIIVVALFLPPVSLLGRLGLAGYTRLNAAKGSISHPDGLTVSGDQETFAGQLRVRLEAVPRLEFLEGSAGSALRAPQV